MIGGYTAAQEHRLKPLQLPDGRKIDIRASFPRSGAYDAKTLKPLWQADIYALDVAMASTSDFSDIAFLGRQGWGGRWGLSFYHEGKLTRRYTCPELVRHLTQDFFFLFTNDDWHLVWYGEMTVDGTTLNFTTANRSIRDGDNFQRFRIGYQESYVFDMRTGAMLSARQTGLGRLALGLLLVCAVPLGWFLRRRHGQPPAQNAQAA